jgi:hypothetical protein
LWSHRRNNPFETDYRFPKEISDEIQQEATKEKPGLYRFGDSIGDSMSTLSQPIFGCDRVDIEFPIEARYIIPDVAYLL